MQCRFGFLRLGVLAEELAALGVGHCELELQKETMAVVATRCVVLRS